MPLRVAALLALMAVGAALGAAASGGFVGTAPAGQQPRPSTLKYYDPLP